MFEQRQQLLAEVDDELRGALAIVASPDLSTRVAKSLSIRQPSKPTFSWGLATAAAILIVAGGMFLTFTAGPGVPSGQPAAPQTAAAPVTNTPAAQAAVAAPVSIPRSPERTRPPRSAAIAHHQLDVLVPTTRARAIARLKELASRGVQESEAPETITVEPQPAEIVIQPLSVADLSVPNLETSGDAGQKNSTKESFR
jgi:hypothetical protein